MPFLENTSLKPFNSFGIEAKARYFSTFGSIDDLLDILQWEECNKGLPLLILGGGSNVLFTRDFDGLLLKNELKGIELVKEDIDHYYVKAMAGENWHSFVNYCLERNYAGIENLSLIPGNVGATPIQNIGAYGVEIKDIFFSLEAYDLIEKKIEVFSLNDCQFDYRNSIFKEKEKGRYIILSVTYLLQKQPVFNIRYGALEGELEAMGITALSIQAISQAVIRIRSSKLPDPSQFGNAGSFFKNPVIPNEQFHALKLRFPNISGYTSGEASMKLAAGWLIEQCGWKGYRKGDAGCFPKQALVLVNYGNATGAEIFELSERIIRDVSNTFQVFLEREVNVF